jgi:hypothetical protein
MAILVSACTSVRTRAPARPSLAGTWTLVAADRELPDGRRVPDYGDRPQGRMMIDEKGRYSIQIFGTDRQRFASGSAAQGTPEEYRGALLSMSTNYGDVTVDWASQTLHVKLEQTSDPNRSGTVQARAFVLDGEVLTYRQPPRADGSRALSAWRRER